MTLATVDPDGAPSSRWVLLRGLSPDGLTFFSHDDGPKGLAISYEPRVAAGFWWPSLERQVRVTGPCSIVSAEESDAYWASRPWSSRLASAASAQSREIPSREWLEAEIALLEVRYPGDVPRPAHWTGFRIAPTAIEFWQGRPSRAHDRILFRRSDEGWSWSRLSP